MTDSMFLYTSRSYFGPRLFRRFDRAVEEMLLDEGYASLEQYAAYLREFDVNHAFIDNGIYVEDGPDIIEIEVE